jgi:hypothetical protein
MIWIKTEDISRDMAGLNWGYEVTILHAFDFPAILFNNILAFLERLGQSSFEKNPRTITVPTLCGNATVLVLKWPDPWYRPLEYRPFGMSGFRRGYIWGKHPFKHIKNTPWRFTPLIVFSVF